MKLIKINQKSTKELALSYMCINSPFINQPLRAVNLVYSCVSSSVIIWFKNTSKWPFLFPIRRLEVTISQSPFYNRRFAISIMQLSFRSFHFSSLYRSHHFAVVDSQLFFSYHFAMAVLPALFRSGGFAVTQCCQMRIAIDFIILWKID